MERFRCSSFAFLEESTLLTFRHAGDFMVEDSGMERLTMGCF